MTHSTPILLHCKLKVLKILSIISLLLAFEMYMNVCPRLFFNEPEVILAMQPARHNIVPNIVHFIRFGNKSVTFIDAVCMLAALKNQKPDRLIIHTDQQPFDGGKYWRLVRDHPLATNVVKIQYLPMPKTIFQKEFNPAYLLWHASDVERLKVLMKYGGIYLDSDSYVVQKLDGFRKYEMTLGWEEGGGISDQVIIAAKNATFLRVWLDSYRDYRADSWFYNGGEKPAELLKERPHLAHIVRRGLAEWRHIPTMIYLKNSDTWKWHMVIHLLINHQYILPRNVSKTATYPVVFNETNILNYDITLRQMVLEIYPYKAT